MTEKQFDQICGIIRSGWPMARFIDNDDICGSLFNSFNRFEFQLVKDTIIGMIERGEYDGSSFAETISAGRIISKVEAEASHRRSSALHDQWTKAVKCPVCQDRGYTMFKYPTGVEVMRPCACPAAKIYYPWAFQTPEERKEWEEAEHQKGHSTPHAWHCKPEEYRRAYYGGNPEEDDKDATVRTEREKLRYAWVDALERALRGFHPNEAP